MKLIVGLGNPGREYEMTRHNIGFLLVDKLFERAGARRFRSESNAKVVEVTLAGQRVLLAKPQTFMNSSGDPVRLLVERYAESDVDLIVACDDAALPFGMIRVRARGSAGGHNGLKSIIERLGTRKFARVRFGVKPNHPVEDIVSFVLSPIPTRDREQLEQMLERGADAVTVILNEGVDRAMSRFNERVKSDA